MTTSFLPPRSTPFHCVIAAAASASDANVTKPKPRLCPVSRSDMTFASLTLPHWENASLSSWVVVLNERFPT